MTPTSPPRTTSLPDTHRYAEPGCSPVDNRDSLGWIKPWLYYSVMSKTESICRSAVVDADALGRVGTALADPTRRRLLLSLVESPAFPSDLADELGLTRGNVSNHLACLRGCGLVSAAPVGRRVLYELADPRLGSALAQLASLVLVATEGSTAGEPCKPDDYAYGDRTGSENWCV